MFRKLNLESCDWQQVLTISVFLFTLAVFTFFIVRAFRMKKPEAERLRHLPVDDESSR